MRRRNLLLLALAVGIGLSLTSVLVARGLEQSETVAHVESVGNPATVNVNLNVEPPTLDPALSTDTTSNNVIEQLFIGLVDLDDETSAIKAELATTWTASADATVYTFTLRADAEWTDGTAITSEDAR